MLQVVTKTVYFSVYKFFSNCQPINLLILLGIITGSNIKPALSQNNSNIIINKNTVGQTINIPGTSGGTIQASDLARTENTPTGYCDGFVNSQPNHILKIDSFFNNLKLEVVSSADTTVLVKSDRNVWCNDDAGSANPMIQGQWQPGIYQVWVGSYQPDSKDSYQIKITDK